MGPLTRNAIDKALEGRPLTESERSFLRGAISKNPNLSDKQRTALLRILQEDADRKRPNGMGGGGSVVIVAPGGSGGGGTVIEGGGAGGGGGTAGVEGGSSAGGSGEEGASGGGEERVTTHKMRYLKVVNASDEDITVFLRYATTRGDEQTWVSTGDDGVLTYQLKPREETYLADGDGNLLASKVRIWAECASGRWLRNKETDVVLVPRPYTAAEPGTFTYTFRK